MIHHLYTAECAHSPKSSFLPSPFSTSPHSLFPLVTTILLSAMHLFLMLDADGHARTFALAVLTAYTKHFSQTSTQLTSAGTQISSQSISWLLYLNGHPHFIFLSLSLQNITFMRNVCLFVHCSIPSTQKNPIAMKALGTQTAVSKCYFSSRRARGS